MARGGESAGFGRGGSGGGKGDSSGTGRALGGTGWAFGGEEEAPSVMEDGEGLVGLTRTGMISSGGIFFLMRMSTLRLMAC